MFHLTDNGDVVAEFLYGKSVDIRHRGSDYIEAYVPIHHLGMASELDGVLRVRAIQPPHPTLSQDDGTGGLNSTQWHGVGFTGHGVKVGVIDIGFEGFSDLMGSELPATVHARCYHQIGGAPVRPFPIAAGVAKTARRWLKRS